MAHWTFTDIPTQKGRSAVVTGTGGLGYETARALAAAGGDVVLAGRNATKGATAVAKIRSETPGATIRFEVLDLADLASVADFGARLAAERESLDLLVNNAGVMMPPARRTTKDGFELQFGTNHLGHFALTSHLLPMLRRGAAPRVVSVSSLAHRGASLKFDDLQYEHPYRTWPSYGQSKLAVLMFALELQRRSDAEGWGLMSNAAHPGFARTDLIANGPGGGTMTAIGSRLIGTVFSHPADMGALPTLFAATAPDAKGGGYYGPDGFMELKGWPAPAVVKPQAMDRAAATRLWDVSRDLTGVAFAA